MIKQGIFSIFKLRRCAIDFVWLKITYKIVSSVREVFVATDASISPPHFTNILVIKIYSQSCIMCLCMVITSTKVSIKMLKTCKYKNGIRLSMNPWTPNIWLKINWTAILAIHHEGGKCRKDVKLPGKRNNQLKS